MADSLTYLLFNNNLSSSVIMFTRTRLSSEEKVLSVWRTVSFSSRIEKTFIRALANTDLLIAGNWHGSPIRKICLPPNNECFDFPNCSTFVELVLIYYDDICFMHYFGRYRALFQILFTVNINL